MFVTISNVLLLSIRWFCDAWRRNRYISVMSCVLRRTSLLIQRCQVGKLPRYEATGIFIASVPLQESEMLTSSKQFVMKDDFLTIHETKTWATVDLSSWLTYRRRTLPPPPSPLSLRLRSADDSLYVLLEAVECDQKADDDQSLIRPQYDLSYHVLNFGTPLAWRSSEPFAVIMSCDRLDNFVKMVDAFGQNKLLIGEGLEVTRMATVHTTGVPQLLSVSEEIFSPAVQKLDSTNFKVSDSSKDSCSPNTNSNDDADLSVQQKTLQNDGHSIHNDNNSQNPSQSSPHDNISGQSSSKLAKKHIKPPNILIYCGVKDTKRKFEDAFESVKTCINTDAYTIYQLKHEQVLSTPWQENAAAVIISSCNRLPSDVKQKICEYVFNHKGNLLSFGSSADNLFVSHLDIVKNDVNENIAKFDFQEWKSVSSFSGPFLYANCREYASVVIPALIDGSSENNLAHVVKLNLEKGGTVILSQLFLEQDPVAQAQDKTSFDLLKKSNAARLSVLRELVSLTGLDTQQSAAPALTHCNLLTQKQNLKTSFLSSLHLKDGMLKSKTLNLVFPPNSQAPDTIPLPNLLPVVTESGDPHGVSDLKFEHFDMTEYWRFLKTNNLGQVVLYTDVISSTMPVFDGMIFSLSKEMSPIAIAGRQVQGKGRAGNTWLSPVGCAMFTLPLCIDLHSNLGQRISFLQHMVSLAVVRGVLTLPGYEDLDLRLKWPNDIYYGKEMKLGGVLVLSSVLGNTVYPIIGCGVNVSNSDPTICINDVICLHNASNPNLSNLLPLTTGQVIATTINCLEQLIQEFESKGQDHVRQLYYKHWLHGGCKVTIDLETKSEGVIEGLDDYGFLSITTTDGDLISVQPDGNSFDMMHNLIHVKSQ